MHKPASTDILPFTLGTGERRQHRRIPGPFEGLRLGFLDTPLLIYDLSAGGCFINSMHEQDEGVVVALKIYIPIEGWIELTAETLYRRPGYGYAVRFIDMDEPMKTRLENAVTKLATSRKR
jgi:hypothetical protein